MSSSGITPPPTSRMSSAFIARMSVQDARENGHVRAGQQADAEHVDVFLDRRGHHLFRGPVQPSVDDLHAGVAEAAGDDLGAAVVAVESDLGDQHSDGSLGGWRGLGHRRRSEPGWR